MLNLKRRKPSFKTVTLLPLQHKLNTPNLYNLFSLIEGVKNESLQASKSRESLGTDVSLG